MFGKFMNNYYYGKSGKGDYQKEDMPQNRWQLFWEMLRIRLSSLLRLNLMYVIAWIPALIVITINAINVFTVWGNMTEENIAQLAGAPQYFLMSALLWLIPCITITGPFTAGASYITRNWARDEHAFIWSDFKDAIKENWKQALLISFITSLMPIILYICWTFYGAQAQTSVLYVIPQVLSLMVVLVWMMSLMYTYPMMVTYKLTFRNLLRNAMLLTIGRLPQTAGLKLLTLIPAVIAFLVAYFASFQWAMLGILLWYILIGFTLSRFIHASYSNAVFDRYINSKLEGVKVDRGIYKPDEEEDDENINAAIPNITDNQDDKQ